MAPATGPQQLPPHPGATTPPPVPVVQATGPVGVLPAPPGPTAPPGPADPPGPPAPPGPSGAHAAEPAPTAALPETAPPRPVRDRAALLGLVLVAASLVALELGLALSFGGESFWADIPLWSAFATLCAVLGLGASAALLPGGRLDPGTGWRVAAAGLVGLAVFWLLVVLPVVATDRGFLLTAALGCLGAALWTGAPRRN